MSELMIREDTLSSLYEKSASPKRIPKPPPTSRFLMGRIPPEMMNPYRSADSSESPVNAEAKEMETKGSNLYLDDLNATGASPCAVVLSCAASGVAMKAMKVRRRVIVRLII